MKSIALFLLIAILSACGQKSSNNKEENNKNVMEQTTKDNQLQEKELRQIDEELSKYIARDKFTGTDSYPGLGDEELREPLNKSLNALAKEFQQVAHHAPSAGKYQKAIKQALSDLGDIYLDSEDQDQFCTSIEELMDIVGLESSGGILNGWRYGP